MNSYEFTLWVTLPNGFEDSIKRTVEASTLLEAEDKAQAEAEEAGYRNIGFASVTKYYDA